MISSVKITTKIIKRNGAQELFDADKIHRVVMAAGLTDAQADKLVHTVVRKLQTLQQKTMRSATLKKIVLAELKKVSEYSSGLYEWYQNTKK